MARNKKFQCYLTEKEYEALQKEAEEQQITMSEIVRVAIAPVVAKHASK